MTTKDLILYTATLAVLIAGSFAAYAATDGWLFLSRDNILIIAGTFAIVNAIRSVKTERTFL